MSPASRRLRSPEPPREIRILWAGMFWVAVVAGLFGVWLAFTSDIPGRGSVLLAVCLATLALYTSLKTWWLVQGLTEALAASTDRIAQAMGALAENTTSPAPGFAAERSAPRSEGRGPGGGDLEGRTDDLGGSR